MFNVLGNHMKNKITAVVLLTIISLTIGITIFASGEKIYNVAIIQHQVFSPFTEARRSFVYYLPKFINVKFIYDFNAKSDIKLLEEKIEEISNKNDIDLIFSIGTHSTTRLIKKIKDVPIIFTICGDPVHSGIVKNWQTSNANYTGIETPDYYSKVITLMRHHVPFKRLGMIYLKGSPSHEAAILQIEKLSKKLDFEFIYDGFRLRNSRGKPRPLDVIRSDIRDNLRNVCPKVDVFFVQTSNAFTKNFDLFRDAFLKYEIIGAGDTMNIKKGLAIGISKDAYRFGRQAAQYAQKILSGTEPKDLPMDVGVKLSIDINLTAFKMAGRKPSFSLISGADRVMR